ncbi:hypothetical protein Hanom_Chr01g00052131 [Helianthus anomalus]
MVTQEDEGSNWNKYIPKEKHALVAEAKKARRWDEKRKCYTDPQGNLVVDSKSVDFKELLDVILTGGELYSKKKEDKKYVANMEKQIREVMLASLKKIEEESIEENVEKMVEKLKKTTEEAIDESHKKIDEDQKKTTEEVVISDQY